MTDCEICPYKEKCKLTQFCIVKENEIDIELSRSASGEPPRKEALK